jgi:hypothetical protein
MSILIPDHRMPRGMSAGARARRSGSLRKLAALGASLALCFAGIAVVASAPAGATPSSLYVNHGATPGSADTSCATAAFSTVQAAVNAASSGDTVYLCGTTPYRGQVIDSTSITLTGDPGASIAATPTWTASGAPLPPQFAADTLFDPQALLVIWGSGVSTTVRGLTISGPLPGNGGCAEDEFGVVVIDGAFANITGDNVTTIRDVTPALIGCQYGVGIQVGREYWPNAGFSTFVTVGFTGTAQITNSTVSGYQKGGIVVDGAGSSASITSDTVTGTGPTTIIAQNGIQISRGATASVSHNVVSLNQYDGPAGASATGVLVYGGCTSPLTTNVSVANNTLTTNDIGAGLFNCGGITTFTTPPSTKTQNTVVHNTISNVASTNISGGDFLKAGCGFQAGVTDFGNHDAIKNNTISGTGYGPHTCTEGPPSAFLFPISTTGSIGVRETHNSPTSGASK